MLELRQVACQTAIQEVTGLNLHLATICLALEIIPQPTIASDREISKIVR